MNSVKQRLRCKRFFIWDFDGCFCDTERIHYQAYEKAFSDFGHTLDESDYYPSFTHLGGGTEREITKHNLKIDPSQLIASKKKYYWENLQTCPITEFPEMKDVARAIRELGGRIAIASNSTAEEIRLILKRTGMEAIPDLVVGYTPELRKKPEPDIFLEALNQFGADRADAVIFEDSDRGLQAADKAGCDAIWVKTPYNEKLTTHVPYLTEYTHAQLLEALRS